jgi:hypothetical protein
MRPMNSGWITTDLIVKAGMATVNAFQYARGDREEQVEAFLQGFFHGSFNLSELKVPVERQVCVDIGGNRSSRVDLFARGVNPKPIEVAVQPSKVKVRNRLCASQNRMEVVKLCSITASAARQRVLFLLDFSPKSKSREKLKTHYQSAFADLDSNHQVRIVYCHPNGSFNFELFSRERRLLS